MPFPPPGDLPDAGIKPASPALSGGFFTAESPGKPPNFLTSLYFFPLINTLAYLQIQICHCWDFPGGSEVKNETCAGGTGTGPMPGEGTKISHAKNERERDRDAIVYSQKVTSFW